MTLEGDTNGTTDIDLADRTASRIRRRRLARIEHEQERSWKDLSRFQRDITWDATGIIDGDQVGDSVRERNSHFGYKVEVGEKKFA